GAAGAGDVQPRPGADTPAAGEPVTAGAGRAESEQAAAPGARSATGAGRRRGAPMRSRGALIGLSLFMAVAVVLTWLVYVTLRRDVAGSTVPYSAVFTDVFGLREGDDVRMAGVRVGRVERIELDGKYAKVSFVVQSDQQVLGNTVASVKIGRASCRERVELTCVA